MKDGTHIPTVKTVGEIMESIGHITVCPVSGETNLYYIVSQHK